MAALLQEQLDVIATLTVGTAGIFQVSVDDVVVARKTYSGFPEPQETVDAVARALGR